MDQDLIERLGERCAAPVRYGVDDCLHLAADVLAEQTGEDVLAGLRPGPIAPDRAQGIVDGHGGLVRFLLRRMRALGWWPVEPTEAAPPAIGLARLGERWAAAFAVGTGWWAARGDDGLTIFDAGHVRRAWWIR